MPSKPRSLSKYLKMTGDVPNSRRRIYPQKRHAAHQSVLSSIWHENKSGCINLPYLVLYGQCELQLFARERRTSSYAVNVCEQDWRVTK